MRIIVTCGSEPQIGRTGENLVTEVAFDTAKWAASYGPGVAQLKVKRPDGEIYVPPITMDGTLAVWTLTTTDTAVSGWLEMEWQYFVDEVHKKSEIIPAWMSESMGPASPEPPEPYQDWVDQVLQAGSDAQAAAQRAQDSAQSAQTSAQSAQSAEDVAGREADRAVLASESADASATAAATAASRYPMIGANGNWWVWSAAAAAYIDTDTSATGPAGPQGDDGPVGPQGDPGPAGAPGIDVWTYRGKDLQTAFADEIAAYGGDPWAWISARIGAADYSGIHVGDYIRFTTTTGVQMTAEIAGIDTYYRYGDVEVPHHIDFITRELWSQLRPVNQVAYNNGLPGTPSSWLCSDLYHWLNALEGDVPGGSTVNPPTTHVDYRANGVYAIMPPQLRAVIVQKRIYAETRYSASGLLSEDNGRAWADIGYLWLPSEIEVYGHRAWGGSSGYTMSGYASGYPLFSDAGRRVKASGTYRSQWWLMTAQNNTSWWCCVSNYGAASSAQTTNQYTRVPLCFRVA